MIQDIYPHKLNNQFEPGVKPMDNDPVLVFDGGKILADTDGWLRIPSVLETGKNANLKFLFKLDGRAYFLADKIEGGLPGYEYTDLKQIREMQIGEKHQIFAFMTGKHLSDWYRDVKFCGRCGCEMKHSETERAMECEKCGYTAYPRIMPAVIVGVTNGNKLLVTRYRTGYQHNALVAGFTEIGETLEETVAREVMEETGLHVKNIRYYKSQPWGMANDILTGFFCDADGDTEIHMDESELKYAEWVERENIVLQPDSSSLTNEMMEFFKNNNL